MPPKPPPLSDAQLRGSKATNLSLRFDLAEVSHDDVSPHTTDALYGTAQGRKELKRRGTVMGLVRQRSFDRYDRKARSEAREAFRAGVEAAMLPPTVEVQSGALTARDAVPAGPLSEPPAKLNMRRSFSFDRVRGGRRRSASDTTVPIAGAPPNVPAAAPAPEKKAGVVTRLRRSLSFQKRVKEGRAGGI